MGERGGGTGIVTSVEQNELFCLSHLFLLVNVSFAIGDKCHSDASFLLFEPAVYLNGHRALSGRNHGVCSFRGNARILNVRLYVVCGGRREGFVLEDPFSRSAGE
ncbi:hypothetical protein CDAR_96721 [Caerostris darwini]|uniref:Secreted protein n=1 Tax=Caerostris darwini TaxID=1538125 RepID=A0AAV4QZ87_9ARAC|nr:hypothetical protein CDAR_96721 [Caerostris darwini]